MNQSWFAYTLLSNDSPPSGGNYDFRLMVNDQYDIMKAISLGVAKVKQFIAERENEFI